MLLCRVFPHCSLCLEMETFKHAACLPRQTLPRVLSRSPLNKEGTAEGAGCSVQRGRGQVCRHVRQHSLCHGHPAISTSLDLLISTSTVVSPVIPLHLATCEAEDSVAEQSATAITSVCVVYMGGRPGQARPGQARGSMNNVEICRRDN